MSAEEEIPKGSEAVGRRVRLPGNAKPPFTVFINGIQQSEGSDYRVAGNEVVFSRQIIKEKMDMSRWLAMYLGLWGTYRKNETVDIQFIRDGKTDLVSDLAVLPD